MPFFKDISGNTWDIDHRTARRAPHADHFLEDLFGFLLGALLLVVVIRVGLVALENQCVLAERVFGVPVELRLLGCAIPEGDEFIPLRNWAESMDVS